MALPPNFYIPGQAEANFICRLCRSTFTTAGQLEHHLTKKGGCMNKNDAKVEDFAHTRRTFHSGKGWADEELEAWIRREGRMPADRKRTNR